MSVTAGVIAAKSNDTVLHKTERGPTRTTHCHLRELSTYQLVTEAVWTHSSRHDWPRSAAL